MVPCTVKAVLWLVSLLILKSHVWAGTGDQGGMDATMTKRLTTGYVPEGGEVIKHHTTLGVIQGLKEPTVGKDSVVSHYYAFRGIPYAHPPIGSLRFADPVDVVETWPNKYLDAMKHGSVCLQFDLTSQEVVGEEDCLFLNVYTPQLTRESASGARGLPVLVFIHGGGYLRASSSVLFAGRLAGQNIIVVTMNYRLGALGFLSTGDTTIPGNFGLLDQLSALRWVKRNIEQFGGDPNQVTIGGFSAGAASVHSHMLSPLAKGLFRGGMIISGAASAPWNIQKDVNENSKQFAEKIKCPATPSLDFKACLLKKTPAEIVRAQVPLLRYEFWPMPFSLVVDAGSRTNPYLPAPVRQLSPTAPIPVLLSIVPQEGILFSLNIILLSNEPTNAEAAYNQVVRDTISSFWFNLHEAELVGKIAETFYYTDEAKSSLNVLFEQLTETLSDFLFTAWSWEAAGMLANAGCPVHTYMMTQRDPETPAWATPLYDLAKKTFGVESPLLKEGISHGDDLAWIFSKTALKRAMDENMAKILVENWAHFVSNGSPLIPEDIWPAISPGGPILYYNISANPHMAQAPYKQKEMNFWLKTIPYINEHLSPKAEENGQGLKPWILGAIGAYFLLSYMNRQN